MTCSALNKESTCTQWRVVSLKHKIIYLQHSKRFKILSIITCSLPIQSNRLVLQLYVQTSEIVLFAQETILIYVLRAQPDNLLKLTYYSNREIFLRKSGSYSNNCYSVICELPSSLLFVLWDQPLLFFLWDQPKGVRVIKDKRENQVKDAFLPVFIVPWPMQAVIVVPIDGNGMFPWCHEASIYVVAHVRLDEYFSPTHTLRVIHHQEGEHISGEKVACTKAEAEAI